MNRLKREIEERHMDIKKYLNSRYGNNHNYKSLNLKSIKRKSAIYRAVLKISNTEGEI